MGDKIYDEATKVSAESDEVMLDGPDGVEVSMTPDAAYQTADRLIDKAAEARGIKLIEEGRRKHPERPHD